LPGHTRPGLDERAQLWDGGALAGGDETLCACGRVDPLGGLIASQTVLCPGIGVVLNLHGVTAGQACEIGSFPSEMRGPWWIDARDDSGQLADPAAVVAAGIRPR